MATELPPAEPQEHRRSRWWPFDGAGRPGRLHPAELTAASAGAAADLPAPADEPKPGNRWVIQGEVITEDQRIAGQLAQDKQEAVADRLPLSAAFRQELRMQLADFAERAHQKRLNPAGPEPLGSGGGITEAVVQTMAEVISVQNLPGPAGSQQDRADLLLGALAATDPKQIAEAGHVSFVTVRGRLMLDVSTAPSGGGPLRTRLVRLPGRSEPDLDAARQDAAGQDDQDAARQDAAGQDDRDAARQDAAEYDQDAAGQYDRDAAGQYDRDAAGQYDRDAAGQYDQDAAGQYDQDAADSLDDGARPARYAAVISGPAAVIAAGRPFLGMDALMTYARRQAFSSLSDGLDPQAARSGMRAAHGIEIVVLLDPSLDGGVWVDVDPATGCPAAAMSIAVWPAGFRFTPLAAA